MYINQYCWSTLSIEQKQQILNRNRHAVKKLEETVAPIVEAVRTQGDKALIHYTKQFNGADLTQHGISVTPEEFENAEANLPEPVKQALQYAIENVRTVHAAQVSHSQSVTPQKGIHITERSTPISSVGLYVPGGRGSFPSMLYMLAVPAHLAQVPHIAVTTPPRPDGSIDPAVLYAAHLSHVQTIFRVGGAQAIAALTWGTESIPRVRKIVGPGSAYVTAAKKCVADYIDTGLPAGPSESMIYADNTADPYTVALDMMIEAEHGSDSTAILITHNTQLAEAVCTHIQELLHDIPEPRHTFLQDVFMGYGGIIIAKDSSEAIHIINEFAPEHLLLHCSSPEQTAEYIHNAAEILIGPHTAFSLANYAAGANAVLPTGGWAHSFSAVSVRDFQKQCSIIHVTAKGYADMRDHVIALSEHEGFPAHAAALRKRNTI